MKRFLLAAALLSSFVIPHSSSAAEPLRVFIRAGKKSHAPGAHDFPQFLKDWVPMLNERGAKADGSLEFPTKEQLDKTDVLILHAQEAGNIQIGTERKNLDEFLARGGGLVVIHAGAVSKDHDWFKSIIGGSWKFGQTKWLEAPMSLYFTDHDNPITKDITNFDMDDEIYYDMDLLPEAKILAAAYTPNTPQVKGGNKEAQARAAEAVAKKKGVNIYDIQPQMWTYERSTGVPPVSSNSGGTPELPKYRAFTCIPGHWYKNFSHVGLRTAILRGIAWAGKRPNVDELCKPNELGDALRYAEGGCPSPQGIVKDLEVHPEFNLTLVASEPLINKPMNIDWDAKGRLWVTETPEYPNGLRQANVEAWKDSGAVKPGQYDRKPQDRISILSDSDGDGIMDKKTVFADEIELATSSVFYKNGVIVCAAPDIWLFEDTNGDDKADKRSKLYTNLGNRDTHAVINNLRWGQDGWIYATHGYSSSEDVTSGDGSKHFGPIGSGVLRFKPDGSAIEQYSSKGGNTWGLDITWDGQVFWTQPTSGIVLLHSVLPEYVLAKGKLPGVQSWKGLMERESTYPAMHWEQQAYVQIDFVGSYTAAAGCAIYEGGAWPKKWDYSYFTTEPTLNIVSHRFVTPDGVSYKAAKEPGREELEFIRSRNLWFRPIEVRVGPDGALYVVDFCNQAVIHNDTRGPVHGPANAAVRPDRDHYYGRIWKVSHKESKKVEVAAAPSDLKGLQDVVKNHTNAKQKQTAWRVLNEKFPSSEISTEISLSRRVGSMAMRAYEKREGDIEVLLEQFANNEDPWIRSAMIAAAADHAVEAITMAMKSPSADKLALFIEASLPGALTKDPAATATKLIAACAGDAKSEALKIAILRGISQQVTEAPAMSAELTAAFKKLLDQPKVASTAFPLIAKWAKTGELADFVNQRIKEMKQVANDPELRGPHGSRAVAILSLLSVGALTPDLYKNAALSLQEPEVDERLKEAIIDAFSSQDGNVAGTVLSMAYPAISPNLQQKAFEAIVKRPDAVNALLDAVKAGTVKAESFSPGDVARLRTHPNKPIAKRANDIFQINNAAKDAIIAKLAPAVEKAGNMANGKMLFTAACAVCHKMDGVGMAVGPELTGMGAHGPAELLVHIVDPNREVDPSFWAFNFTTKKGETLQGVITAENSATVTLATQVGVREIAKSDIVNRENTRRSLMPEGLDALGPDALRDILAYICGDAQKQFRILHLADGFTADSREGVFAGPGPNQGQVRLKKFGLVKIQGVPFFIQDPAKNATASNIIVLKGGPAKSQSDTFPAKVEVPVNVAAKRLQLLSGISGWGWPAVREEEPALKATVVYDSGEREEFTLVNGIHFSDYIRPVEVPGSRLVEEDLTDGQQMRLVTLELTKPGIVKKLVLESPANNKTAPVIAAITADIEGKGPAAGSADPSKRPPPPAKDKGKGKGEKGAADAKPEDNPKAGGPGDGPLVPVTPVSWEAGKTKVLVIGGGSSHNFAEFFGKTDVATLKAAGFSVHYTEDRDQAASELANADVAVISVNRKFFDTAAYRKAVFDFAAAGKGLIMLHPGTWYGYASWPELNAQIVGGGSRGHDKIHPFDVKAVKADHPVMAGVPASFTVEDELYYMNAEPANIPPGTAKITVLAETSPSDKYKAGHPSVWITDHAKAKIVGIALGHDARTHDLVPYKTLLSNAVKWASGK